MEVVGLALHEAVEPVETSLHRPIAEWPCRRCFPHRGQVPLAHTERRPSGRLQHLGDGGRRRIDPTAHVGKARVEVRHGAHADGVVVAAGQQARPRGRTESGRVEVAVSQAASCEPIEVRGVDGGSEATEVGKSCVVEERYENVGRRRGWNIGLRPPWRGIGDLACNDTVEGLIHVSPLDVRYRRSRGPNVWLRARRRPESGHRRSGQGPN